MQKDGVAVKLPSPGAGKFVVCSLFRSHGPYINIHDAYCLYDKLAYSNTGSRNERHKNVQTKSGNKCSIPQVLILELCQYCISIGHKCCMMHNVHNFVVNNFIYIGLNQLCLVHHLRQN